MRDATRVNPWDVSIVIFLLQGVKQQKTLGRGWHKLENKRTIKIMDDNNSQQKK